MTVHTELTPAEAADRLALRELFYAYAHCADRRDAEGQKAIFAEDTRFERYARPGAEAVARHVACTDPAARRRALTFRMQSFGVTGTAGRRAPDKARLRRPGDASRPPQPHLLRLSPPG